MELQHDLEQGTSVRFRSGIGRPGSVCIKLTIDAAAPDLSPAPLVGRHRHSVFFGGRGHVFLCPDAAAERTEASTGQDRIRHQANGHWLPVLEVRGWAHSVYYPRQ